MFLSVLLNCGRWYNANFQEIINVLLWHFQLPGGQLNHTTLFGMHQRFLRLHFEMQTLANVRDLVM